MHVSKSSIPTVIEDLRKNGCGAFFLHGKDYAAKESMSSKLMEAFGVNNNTNVITIHSSTVEHDPSLLYNELLNIDLLGRKKAIQVKDVGHNFTKICKKIGEEIYRDTLLILISDNNDSGLKSSSCIHYNKATYISSIGCYKLPDSNTLTLIKSMLDQYNLLYNNEVVRAILSYINGDALLLHSELQKLILYLGDRKHIEVQDIDCVFFTRESESVFVFIDALMSKNQLLSYRLLYDTLSDNISVIAILRLLMAHVAILRNTLVSVADGKNIEEEIAKSSIFFKRVESFRLQLKLWNVNSISKLMRYLLSLECDHKDGLDIYDTYMMEKMIINICAQ